MHESYEEHLKKAVNVTAEGVNLHIDHAWEVTPELIMNLMMHNTLEKGKDISQCAELYTVGIDGAGFAVVADSFGALETRVEKEKLITWEDMLEAHKDPTLHPDLVVCVTGFTAYFASLSLKFRQLMVDRFLKGV